MRTRRPRDRPGVSEVVGALLLIIVVVTAVASLSYFLANAQQQAQNRSNYLTNVHNDNLETVYAQFSPADPTIQFELDGCTLGGFTGNWDVQQIVSNPALVNLVPIGITGALTVQANFGVGSYYNAISNGQEAVPSGATSPFTLTFGAGPPTCTFNTASWNAITLAVRNTNTQPSSITGVQLNSVYTSTWYQVDQSGNVLGKLGVTVPLPIPAKGSVNIMFNRTSFGSTSLLKNDSLSVVLQSGSGNFFPRTFTFPTALQRSSTSTQNYGVTSRDVLSLDGSQSFATNSSIQSYEWKLDIPTATYVGSNGCTSAAVAAFGNPANYDTAYASGQTLQYAPESLFASHLGDCIIGPIRATLLVADTNGFMAASQPIVIAPDSNIDPIGSISASKTGSACSPTPCTSTYTVTVTVHDIFGNTVNGAVVNAVAVFGDATASPLSTTTAGAGQATFTVTFISGGSMDFETGNLLPALVSFP